MCDEQNIELCADINMSDDSLNSNGTIDDYIEQNAYFICENEGCNKSFQSIKRLNEHKKRHSRPYVCTDDELVCKKRFGSRWDLNMHRKRMHSVAK